MNFGLYKNLRKARKELSPSREFKKALWSELDKRWGEKHLPDFRWYETAWFRFSGAVMTGIVGFTSVGTAAYAYTSPEVTQGTSLYPIKQAIEQIEETIKVTPEAKAKFLLKKIERRKAEKDVLEKQVEREDEDNSVVSSTFQMEGQTENEDQITTSTFGQGVEHENDEDSFTQTASSTASSTESVLSTSTRRRGDDGQRQKTKRKHDKQKIQSMINLEKTDSSINSTEQELNNVKEQVQDEGLKNAIEQQLESIKKSREEMRERKKDREESARKDNEEQNQNLEKNQKTGERKNSDGRQEEGQSAENN